MSTPLPEAHVRGRPTSTKHALLVSKPCLARSGYLLRVVSQDVTANRTVAIVDFGSGEIEFLASCSRAGRVVLADAAAREHIFPIGGWSVAPRAPAAALARWLAGWLHPHGALADAADVLAAIDALSLLPVVAPRATLYAWRRFVLDRPWRTEALRDLAKSGINVEALANARPGTGLGRLLEERVNHVLGHDDTIERVFPVAAPRTTTRPSSRCLRRQTHPWLSLIARRRRCAPARPTRDRPPRWQEGTSRYSGTELP